VVRKTVKKGLSQAQFAVRIEVFTPTERGAGTTDRSQRPQRRRPLLSQKTHLFTGLGAESRAMRATRLKDLSPQTNENHMSGGRRSPAPRSKRCLTAPNGVNQRRCKAPALVRGRFLPMLSVQMVDGENRRQFVSEQEAQVKKKRFI